ncbi:unnamed protein product [Pleuronectes platessa]|uniref:Uncharacterized protein n=1 Tax=Pleuronectes platessa TaxID=8262 RepID=A0A9N7YVU1_PLEPL|nr:unnamed protein product [Pleuronectes platessa]
MKQTVGSSELFSLPLPPPHHLAHVSQTCMTTEYLSSPSRPERLFIPASLAPSLPPSLSSPDSCAHRYAAARPAVYAGRVEREREGGRESQFSSGDRIQLEGHDPK